jgi:hypothetical protein
VEDTKKEAVIDEQVEQNQDDSGNFDLTEELISFNKGESPEGTEDNVDVVESDKQEVVEAKEVSKEAVEDWLIDNKFKDTEEGREKLAESYKNLQSEYDKLKNSPEEDGRAKEAIAFAEWVANNDEAREAINSISNKESNPQLEVPDDFDPLEMYTEGTSSNEWWKSSQDAERNKLRQEITTQVSGEFDKRDNKVKEQEEATSMIEYLSKEQNLSEAEIADYLEFVGNEDSYSPDNLVQLYRMTKGDAVQPQNNKLVNPESQTQMTKDIPQNVNAAVSTGVNPPAETNPVDSLMDSLMSNSKREFTID